MYTRYFIYIYIKYEEMFKYYIINIALFVTLFLTVEYVIKLLLNPPRAPHPSRSHRRRLCVV